MSKILAEHEGLVAVPGQPVETEKYTSLKFRAPQKAKLRRIQDALKNYPVDVEVANASLEFQVQHDADAEADPIRWTELYTFDSLLKIGLIFIGLTTWFLWR